MQDKRLDQFKKLYDLGFCLLRLRANSKKPVDANWPRNPRPQWDEFVKRLKPTENVGARLGENLNGGYLAVFDCDVKLTGNAEADQANRKEMTQTLKKLFPQVTKLPRVRSGSGLGSHIYFLTKEPISQVVICASKKTIIPAGKKQERPVWEVMVYSRSRQVALPPSVHPSGGMYKWEVEIKDANDLVLIDHPLFDKAVQTPDDVTPANSLPPMPEWELIDAPIDFESDPRIDPETRDMIIEGTPRTGEEDKPIDRSTELYICAESLFKSCLKPEEVMNVLLNPNYFLGEVAHERRSGDMRAAGDWLWKYIVAPAYQNASPFSQFEVVENDQPEMPEWMRGLQRSKNKYNYGKILDIFPNIRLLLVNLISADCLQYDEFGNRTLWHIPFETEVTNQMGLYHKDSLTDNHVAQIRDYFATYSDPKFRVDFTKTKVWEALEAIALSNKFHPVRDYLKPLKWDGVKRLDTWLETYLGAQGPKEYLRAVSRITLTAMVARVMNPGTKFDHVLILEGPQGVGKSTAIRHLASDPWFTDSELDTRDKDSVLSIQGAWLVELGELSTMFKNEVNSLKAFITRNVDKIRPPFGRSVIEYGRQCVFMGTTNFDGYLKDTSGNRRFWPVQITGYDYVNAPLLKDRDQLFAEAKIEWELGTTDLYLTGVAAEQALAVQENRMEESHFIDLFEEWMGRNSKDHAAVLDEPFKISKLFEIGGPFEKLVFNVNLKREARVALKQLGFEEFLTKEIGRKQVRKWRRKTE